MQRLQEIVKTCGFKTITKFLKEDLPQAHFVPKEENFGIAVSRKEEVLRKCDWWVLPVGLMCASCFNQVPNVFPTSTSDKRVCRACSRGNFPQTSQAKGAKLSMVRYPPFSTKGVNHVAFVGRQSRGHFLTEQSFDGLKSFARQWSDFPFRTTKIQNWVGCFGANGSALATHSAMHEKLDKNPNGTTFIPLSELVFRLCAFHRPGCDHVTIVFYNFTSFTVKSQNLMEILSDFEKANVILKDVSFVSYGNPDETRLWIMFSKISIEHEQQMDMDMENSVRKHSRNSLFFIIHLRVLYEMLN
ncbi:Uncharacterized protein APZ42_015234 [Daphnia magna]|uniref:Uncharacterized protein n=1 Tax=Daphnia magna TaxID=35525 RepID=A0A162PAX3_9CRUS|nr:Uncharacterized protein APZ42_015234 [Daphnia magna]